MKGFKTLCLFPKIFEITSITSLYMYKNMILGMGVTILSLSVTVYVIDGQTCLLVQKINKNLKLLNKSWEFVTHFHTRTHMNLWLSITKIRTDLRCYSNIKKYNIRKMIVGVKIHNAIKVSTFRNGKLRLCKSLKTEL